MYEMISKDKTSSMSYMTKRNISVPKLANITDRKPFYMISGPITNRSFGLKKQKTTTSGRSPGLLSEDN